MSPASFPRRIGALVIDWLCCVLLARAFTPSAWAPLAVFAIENVLLLTTLGATFGQRLVGIRVVRPGSPASGGPVPPRAALIRTALLVLVIPAVVWDREGRGLHDKAAGTLVVRAFGRGGGLDNSGRKS